jgi:hypothetical protein
MGSTPFTGSRIIQVWRDSDYTANRPKTATQTAVGGKAGTLMLPTINLMYRIASIIGLLLVYVVGVVSVVQNAAAGGVQLLLAAGTLAGLVIIAVLFVWEWRKMHLQSSERQ